MDEYIKKVVSMAIQDLRQRNEGAIIDMIKKSDYHLEWIHSDSWNGGTDYYKLVFYIGYSDFSQISSTKSVYEEEIMRSISIFHNDELNVISHVEISPRIVQFIDWAAIAPDETKSSVISLINEEQDFLIKAGIGELQIKNTETNSLYKAKHTYLSTLLKQLGLSPIHQYNDLWDWYKDYKRRNLSSYQSRRMFIRDIYAPLIEMIQSSDDSNLNLLRYEPTGWEKVDAGMARLKDVLLKASKTTDFQSVGMYGRELLITLAQAVYDKEKHPSQDGVDISKTDSKRMLEAYIHFCLRKHSKEREIKFAKSSIDFSNELTHNRTATQMDAELCYNAVLSTIHIIKILYKYNS